MRQLPPLRLRQAYFKIVEQEINKLFFEIIYKPLLPVLETTKAKIENASPQGPLHKAIQSGKVWFSDGAFHGEYNAGISKDLRSIGATFNKRTKAWGFDGILPAYISTAQVHAASKFTIMRNKIITVLDQIDIDKINEISSIPDVYIDSINMMERDFQKTTRGIAIAPTMTQEAKNIIAADWGQNLDLFIKDWTKDNIFKLREAVEKNTFEGKRSTQLVKYIQDNFGVSKRKATFLARQETALLMSKFQETRYKDIGITKYRWSGTLDTRERQDHLDLEGKVYTWDNPPIVNKDTGRRANPGEDFGCRCVAIALID